MKKRILPVAILIAFIASVVTFAVLLNIEKNVLSEYEQETVWVLREEMPAGTECTEENLSQYMEQVLADKRRLPEKRVTALEELKGLRSIANLPKGSMLTLMMFNGEREEIEGMREPVIAGCKAEDLYQLVSGSLRKGDHINLYTVDEEMGEARLLWEDVLVYEAFDTAGKRISVTDTETAAARINIVLEKEVAELFYTELCRGSLRAVTLVAR